MDNKDRRGSGLGTTLVLALVIVALSMVLGVGLARYGGIFPIIGPFFDGGGTKITTSPVVVEGIQQLNQLATVRWTESTVVTKESEGNFLPRWLTGDKVLLVASGEVEAGVNLASLDSEDVEVEGEKVTIRLPEPEIFSSSLDEEKTGVYDREQGFLLGPNDTMVEEARRDTEREFTAVAQENGILDQARQNAEDSVGAFVMSLGFKEVEFVG